MAQGAKFEGRPTVTLVTIESERVLLDNYGTLEQLPLDPDGIQLTGEGGLLDGDPEYELGEDERERRRAMGERLRALRDDEREPVITRGGLLEDVDVLPLYEDEELSGRGAERGAPRQPLRTRRAAGGRRGPVGQWRVARRAHRRGGSARQGALEQGPSRSRSSVGTDRSASSRSRSRSCSATRRAELGGAGALLGAP